MEKLKGSTILIVLGIALLAFGVAYPFVTLVIDNTPPIIVSTVPADGQTYATLTAVSIHVKDPESGIRAVAFAIYNPSGVQLMGGALSLQTGDMYDGTWGGNIAAITTPGNGYTAWFRASNQMYMNTEITVHFNIYTALQGDWYIANIKITSSSQTVYSNTTSINFKFQKTAGIDDSYISCWIEEGGTKILTLTLTDTTNHIWTGTYTFTPGTHNLAIKAYDGTTTITYSIVGLTIPGAFIWVITTQQALLLAGVLAIVAGVVMRIKKK
jgi:hypothetical protein